MIFVNHKKHERKYEYIVQTMLKISIYVIELEDTKKHTLYVILKNND